MIHPLFFKQISIWMVPNRLCTTGMIPAFLAQMEMMIVTNGIQEYLSKTGKNSSWYSWRYENVAKTNIHMAAINWVVVNNIFGWKRRIQNGIAPEIVLKIDMPRLRHGVLLEIGVHDLDCLELSRLQSWTILHWVQILWDWLVLVFPSVNPPNSRIERKILEFAN